MLLATTFKIVEIVDRFFVSVYVASHQILTLNLQLQQEKQNCRSLNVDFVTS